MSQSIDLDFIQAPLFSLSRYAWLRLAVLFAGLVALAITWQAYQHKHAELAAVKEALAQLQQAKKTQPIVKVVNITIAPDKLKQLQESAATLAIPWHALFEAIENTQHKEVTLLSLEPNAKKQLLLLNGEAKNLQIALQYVAQLQKQAALSQVFLQKHIVDESNASKPVRFSVQARWEMPL